MLMIEDQPYRDVMEQWFKQIGYAPAFYENHTPVAVSGSVKRLTKRQRALVDSLSRDRGYRRFHAFGRTF